MFPGFLFWAEGHSEPSQNRNIQKQIYRLMSQFCKRKGWPANNWPATTKMWWSLLNSMLFSYELALKPEGSSSTSLKTEILGYFGSSSVSQVCISNACGVQSGACRSHPKCAANSILGFKNWWKILSDWKWCWQKTDALKDRILCTDRLRVNIFLTHYVYEYSHLCAKCLLSIPHIQI